MFLCGNHAEAKSRVTALLRDFAWVDIVDLGDIKAARGLEMFVPAWLSLLDVVGHSHFGFQIVGR